MVLRSLINNIFNLIYFLIFSQTTKTGLAKNIEEYVPINIPMDKAKTKDFIEPPPKNKMESKTKSVVTEVFTERLIVWLTLELTVSSKLSSLLGKFSRTLSKTTIVSLTE